MGWPDTAIRSCHALDHLVATIRSAMPRITNVAHNARLEVDDDGQPFHFTNCSAALGGRFFEIGHAQAEVG
jgi:hypothetical protein